MLIMFSLVCFLVCQQDSTKTTEQISIKLGSWMGLGPEKTSLMVGRLTFINIVSLVAYLTISLINR